MVAFTSVMRSIVVAAVLVAGCSASIVPPSQSCLHGPDGKVSVADIFLAPVSRQACSESDQACLCQMAVKYNTAIRAKHGKGPVAIGNQAMLDNAIKHGREMEGGPFEHQNLGKVTDEVQCKVFCSGENIAKYSGKSDDPAKKCMDMWENSSGHLANILRDNDYTVIGIYISNGWTYCTQTFGLKGSGKGDESGPKCAPVGGGSSPSADTPTDAPTTKAVTNAKTTKASTYAQTEAKPTDETPTKPTEKPVEPSAAPYSPPMTEAPKPTEAPMPTYAAKPTYAPRRRQSRYQRKRMNNVKGTVGTAPTYF
jgi:uncharacterized protein YkwD